jgi:acetylornithine deacetylase
VSIGDMDGRISQAVDARASDIVQFASELIQINSESGHEGEIQGFVAEHLRSIGLEVDEVEVVPEDLVSLPDFVPAPGRDFSGRSNIVGRLSGSSRSAKSLLLNGHVDTIPSGPQAAWAAGPFSGAVREGLLYGRGASDMKGGLAAMTMAVVILLDAGLRPRGDLVLEYVIDEEVTGYGTLACVARGYSADAGICCETSDLSVMPACIGRLWFTVEIHGKSAGISSRWDGVSAIELGAKIVAAFENLEAMRIADLHHPLYPDNKIALPCVVTMFDSGTFPSAVPDRAVLRGSLGLMPQEDIDDVKRAVHDQVGRVAAADPWMRREPPVVTFGERARAGAEIPSDHPIVRAVAESYQAATGEAAKIRGRTGGSDTRHLINAGGTPTVIFGPGVTAQMHALDEWVPVANLITATKTLALTINRWCR